MLQTIDKRWLKTKLPKTLAGFTQAWRDESDCEPNSHKNLILCGQALGHLQLETYNVVIEALVEQSLDFTVTLNQLELKVAENDLKDALTQLGQALHAKGYVPGWRNELQTLYDLSGRALCDLERGLFKTLGLCSQAIHVHAENEEGLVWLGIRAQSKLENPGMLDNLTAGGVAAQEQFLESIRRELAEEAGFFDAESLLASGESLCAYLDEELEPNGIKGFLNLNTALNGLLDFPQLQQSLIRVSRPHGKGWHHELILLGHLRVKSDWMPCNQDGEVQGFILLTPKQCAEAVNTQKMTPDAALTTALALRAAI